MAAKNDSDLFERLRSAGLRKQAARRLSAIGEDAGRKAVGAARAAIAELRTVADEIERRLPVERRHRSAGGQARPSNSETQDRAPAPDVQAHAAASGATARTDNSRATRAEASSVRTKAPAGRAKAPDARAKASDARAKAPAGRTKAPAPRGHNKALILQALADGPKTAAEVAKQTGLATGTTSTTLNKLARRGEVVKATRGYALPSSPAAKTSAAPAGSSEAAPDSG
jgi:hypothetical protein